jgi:SAM-dependent methyltransferase
MPKAPGFWWRYLRGRAPWDTGITPPEIVALADQLPPGRVLDLGCGTGTSLIELGRRGWTGDGVDFVGAAVGRARAKARRAGLKAGTIRFHRGDVTHLPFLTGPYDLVIDVGCFHAVEKDRQPAYVGEVTRLTRPGATYALYTSCPRMFDGTLRGFTPEEIERLFAGSWHVQSVTLGTDTSSGFQSGWYVLKRQ